MGAKIEKFEDLEVWKLGMQLAEKTYRSLKGCNDYSLRDQMQRPALSVPSNIAEGYERNSNRDFIRHLFIAQGSCAELRTQIYLCMKIRQLSNADGQLLLDGTKKLSAMLYNLIKTRKERF